MLFLLFFLTLYSSSKIVRWKGYELYDCDLVNQYLIECEVKKDNIEFPTHINYHLHHGEFDSSEVYTLKRGHTFILKDNDQYLEFKIIRRPFVDEIGWIHEPSIKYDGFKDLKQYLTA